MLRWDRAAGGVLAVDERRHAGDALCFCVLEGLAELGPQLLVGERVPNLRALVCAARNLDGPLADEAGLALEQFVLVGGAQPPPNRVGVGLHLLVDPADNLPEGNAFDGGVNAELVGALDGLQYVGVIEQQFRGDAAAADVD